MRFDFYGLKLALRRAREARGGTDDGVALLFVLRARRGHAGELLLDDAGEFRHLLFHFDELLAHVENDFDTGEVHAHIAGESQNYVEAFEIGVGVEPRVSLRTGRFEKPYAFVKAERLRMELVELRHGADHVAGFGAFSSSLWHSLVSLPRGRVTSSPNSSTRGMACRAPHPNFHQTPALANRSFRGSSGATSSKSFMSLRTRSSVGCGTTT